MLTILKYDDYNILRSSYFGALTAYSQEMGALLIIIGVVSLSIGLLVLREAGKANPSREPLVNLEFKGAI
ncbi:hypothetical protein [Paenibacillus sp.]|uniref:hypothetical protein n=1 Tax=Paenibacillus sp. TaxID=58172 RepID=UPI0028AA2057|nr:hypothetical protein [Paenibacillus sp.]